ncbi:MAG: carbohydrate ABC transporter permease, partial [Pseudomonadota bacterium]
MDGMAGQKAGLTWAVHISVAFLVLLWLIPTIGLAVSSFRDRDQIGQSAWWESAFPVEQPFRARAEGSFRPEGDMWVIEGNVFEASEVAADFADGRPPLTAFGLTGREPGAFAVGEEAPNRDNGTTVVNADGSFVFSTDENPDEEGFPRIYFIAETPPDFDLENYDTVLGGAGMGQAFINTLTVTIPATIIPILIAAFAAYALAWMEFPGRGLLIACIVGLLVVPLQLALVPLLKLHQQVGIGQSFVGIWLAHTGFGLPLAIYLLRNYMVGLPRDIIESAKVDGATDFQIFLKIILPLSFPALASFAIFQFLWTWNDLLVAKVFLPANDESWVMTVRIADDLLGSRGGDWGILAAAAFVSIGVPLLVFFTMQRYLVRGL